MPDGRPEPRPALVAAALVGALVAAVLLAGPVHTAIAGFGGAPEFAKVFRYVALGLLAAAVAATLRPWRDVPRDVWGLRGPAGRTARLVLAGFALLAALLTVVALVHAAAGAVRWDDSPSAAHKFAQRLPKYLLPALPFAFVEETFFRGWLVDRFARRRSALAAAALASVVFGVVHAFHAQYAPDVAPGPAGALEILRSWGEHLLDVASFGPRFLGLSLFALALCAARQRFHTLALGVGAHAAAYAFLPLFSALTEPAGRNAIAAAPGAPEADVRSWLGSKWLYDGVPGIVLLALLAFVLWPRRRSSETATGASGSRR